MPSRHLPEYMHTPFCNYYNHKTLHCFRRIEFPSPFPKKVKHLCGSLTNKVGLLTSDDAAKIEAAEHDPEAAGTEHYYSVSGGKANSNPTPSKH